MEEKVICMYKECKNLNKKNKYNTNNNFICKCCDKKFCSDSCLIEHMIELDKELKFNRKNKKIKSNSKYSTFIKQGKMLDIFERDSYYDINNLQKVKIANQSRVLGNGAFGEVYLAMHKIDRKYYAIKQLDKKRLQSAGINLDIVYREINIHLRLLHEHIARLFSYHEDNQAFYLILEYVDNGTLFSVIQNNKGVTEQEAFKYFIQVVSAIHFLHSNNLIHRDLKPENCLVDKDGGVKICDFGWTVESNKSRVTFCGTYEYMAPEIVKELPYDHSVDIWSLGILLYELIHSYSPFRARKVNKKDHNSTSLEVLQNIISYKFQIDKNVTNECKDLIYKLLSPNNKERITTKDIFEHPWVRNFEVKEVKDNNILKSIDLTVKNEQSQNDLTMISEFPTQTDDLFNNVLSQVQGRNKKKRKTQSHILRYSIDSLNKQIEEEKQKQNNKIVLKVEKVDKFVDNTIQISSSKILSPIKAIKNENDCDESTFSIFKEMREIDSQLNATLKKIESIPKQIKQMQKDNKRIENEKIKKTKTQNYDSYNCFENEKTQPTINTSVKYYENNNKSNLNDQIYFKNTIRESNKKFKQGGKGYKNLKDGGLESMYTSKISQRTNDNGFNFDEDITKNEISTQTEKQPDKNASCTGGGDKNWSLFGFFRVFKCGG